MEGVFQKIDDVVVLMDQAVDVFPVERGDEALVDEVDDPMGDIIRPVFDFLGFLPIFLEIAEFDGKCVKDIGDFGKADRHFLEVLGERGGFGKKKFHDDALGKMRNINAAEGDCDGRRTAMRESLYPTRRRKSNQAPRAGTGAFSALRNPRPAFSA